MVQEACGVCDVVIRGASSQSDGRVVEMALRGGDEAGYRWWGRNGRRGTVFEVKADDERVESRVSRGGCSGHA